MKMYRLISLSSTSILWYFCSNLYGLNCESPKVKCGDAVSSKPCGPFCSAVRVNNTLYMSGVIGIDEITNKLTDGDIKHETEVVFNNVKNILEEFGSSLDKVANVRIYVDDLDNTRAVNDLYATYFLYPYPARTLVEVSKLREVREGARIEVEVIASIDGPGRFIEPQTKMSF